MKLKDICILDVACCTSEISILAAARMMRQQHTGDLIVIDDRDEERIPVGILTDRDIVIEVLGQGLDPAKATVADAMTTQLVVASGFEEVSLAIERMRAHGVRRVPVVDDDGCVMGIVTLDDMLKLHAEQAGALLEIISKEQAMEGRARR
jgi:CBS domain-containing protein